jgi:hypothetical protein
MNSFSFGDSVLTVRLLGACILLVALWLLIIGIRYKDSDGDYLTKIRLIGISLLLAIPGYFLLISDKTWNEIFHP